MEYVLRDYQEKGKKDFEEFIYDSEHKKGIAVKPVGTGKALDTAIIAELCNEDVLVIQPNIELLEQNLEKARSFGLDPSVYSASANSKTISNLTYATPMSIASDPSLFSKKKIVIIDEAHLMLSNKMKNGKVSEKGKLGKFLDEIKPKKQIGLTATPIQLVTTGRGSELKMINRSMRSHWYKSDIFHVTQIGDVHEKYWADITTDIIENETNVLEKKSFNSPEFTKESIVEQYNESNFDKKILEQYERMSSSGIKSILTFVPSVEQATALSRSNKDFAVVYDKTPRKERKAIVEAFKKGDIPMLLNCMVFTAGFDSPTLDGLIMARDTMSYQLFYQIYGRIVRPIYNNGVIIKKKGLIVDLTGNTERFGDPKDLTFEKNDYTNGWGMWNGDSLLTGYPFGDWEMPQRKTLSSEYNKQGVINVDEKIDNPILNFGKYKNKRLKESFEKDPRYFVWVKENFDFSRPNVKKYEEPIQKLIQKNLMHGK